MIGYRADSGLSHTELAARLGLNQSVVARLEATEHVPKFADILEAALERVILVGLTEASIPGSSTRCVTGH